MIYANNGSGKSTLASLMNPSSSLEGWNAGIAVEVASKFGESSSKITSPSDDFWDKVVVFNKDYVEESFDFHQGEATALLALGKADADREKKLRKKKDDLEIASGATANLHKLATDASKLPMEILRGIGKTIATNLGTIPEYDGRSYNAGTVKKNLGRAMASKDRDLFDLEGHKTQSKATRQKTIHFPTSELEWTPIARTDVEQIIARVPTAKPIDGLKDDPGLSHWVQTGMALHDKLDVCQFCTQEFTIDRLTELQRHFDISTQTLQDDLGQMLAKIRQAKDNTEKIKRGLPDDGLIYADMRADYVAATDSLREECGLTMNRLRTLESVVEGKQAKLFEALSIDDSLNIPSTTQPPNFVALNAVLKKHNDKTEAFESSVVRAARKLEEYWIGEELDRFNGATAAETSAKNEYAKNETQIGELRREIAQLESADFNPGPPAEWLTDRLHRLLGRHELEVQATGSNRYSILRDGRPAKHLSEGERTALSLLYFVKALGDKGRSLRDLVIIIDDPVSSLDESFTVGVSGLLWAELIQPEVCGCGQPKGCKCNLYKKPMRDCGQIFLLTHNFELFRMWTTQLDRLQGPVLNADRSYRILELKARAHKNSDGSISRRPRWHEWSPKSGSKTVRTKLRSEYHYLFLKAADTLVSIADEEPTVEDEMEAAVVLPNVCRRLLEGFLSFKYPEKMGDFREQMKAAIDSIDEGATRTRLVTYLHQYSHNEYIDTTKGVNRPEAPAILHSVFTLIREKDPEHFAAMCEALELAPEMLTSRLDSELWIPDPN